MKNYNLTPYDWDLVGMIENLIKEKCSVAVDNKNNRFEIYWKLPRETENYDQTHKAITGAIKGRVGDRYMVTNKAPLNVTYIKFDTKVWETEEIRFEIKKPDDIMGDDYIRKVKAIVFNPVYPDLIADFVGGGNFIKSNSETIPSRFEFLNESGLLTTVNEGDYVVFQDGKFEVIKKRIFENQFKIVE